MVLVQASYKFPFRMSTWAGGSEGLIGLKFHIELDFSNSKEALVPHYVGPFRERDLRKNKTKMEVEGIFFF